MKQLELNVQDIKDLMDHFSRGNMGKLELQQGDFVLKLESRQVEQVAVATVASSPVTAAAAEPQAEEAALPGNLVTSPIVGTFYAAPAPDKDPYVTVGSRVNKGDVLFIIESMKLMNEVISEYDGTVTKVLVDNAQAVEYGQPILCIE